jgi:hypothetical protein
MRELMIPETKPYDACCISKGAVILSTKSMPVPLLFCFDAGKLLFALSVSPAILAVARCWIQKWVGINIMLNPLKKSANASPDNFFAK